MLGAALFFASQPPCEQKQSAPRTALARLPGVVMDFNPPLQAEQVLPHHYDLEGI